MPQSMQVLNSEGLQNSLPRLAHRPSSAPRHQKGTRWLLRALGLPAAGLAMNGALCDSRQGSHASFQRSLRALNEACGLTPCQRARSLFLGALAHAALLASQAPGKQPGQAGAAQISPSVKQQSWENYVAFVLCFFTYRAISPTA